MAKQDRHLTTARLSAFIDGQLSPEEQAQSEAHLSNCEVCQQQLAELRQTVTLLHALPQPPLPRSFTLPIAESAAIRGVARSARPLNPITPLSRHYGLPSYVTGAVRVVSTLAAVLGIVFLLSGLFGTVIHGGGTSASTSSGGSTTSGQYQGGSQPLTPHIQGTTPTPTPTTEPSVRGTDKHEQPPVQQQNPLQSFLAIFDLAGMRALIGILLLVLGIIGFVVVRRL
ncbi:MAG: hypothetical protein NVSMB49_25980 [Ktedonobacteraceae bacterium]